MKTLVRIEYLLIGIFFLYLYIAEGHNLLLAILLSLAPDLSMLFYKRNNRFGAIVYNALHVYFIPLSILILDMIFIHHDLLQAIMFIWLIHISLDRFFGYGLKYETGFKDTHMQRL